MYLEIEHVKSVSEIEQILFKQSDDFYFIDNEVKSVEYKNSVKSLGARYLIKKSILDYLKIENNFDDIEIANEESGKPVVIFRNYVQERIQEEDIKNVQVSISHSRNFVTTLVVIE